MDYERFGILEADLYGKTPISDNYEDRPTVLQELLVSLPPQEVCSFQRHFDEAMARSYTRKLWGAAYFLNGGCSDDGFEYFRGWLISEGKETFEKALIGPDSLAELRVVDVQLEDMPGLAPFVYYELTGTEMPMCDVPLPDLYGERWKDEELPLLYPWIAALLSESSSNEPSE